MFKYLGTSTFFSGGRRSFFRGLLSTAGAAPTAVTWDICQNASNMRPKIISIGTTSNGLRRPRYGGSSAWVITWSAWGTRLDRLVAGGRCFCPHLPKGGVARTRSAVEGMDCSVMPNPIGPGAVGSTEIAPSSPVSSPAGTFWSADAQSHHHWIS
jgi:hypothetical protein